MQRLVILNGPNTNFFGIRNPEQYGQVNYKDMIAAALSYARECGFDAQEFQANGEGELIDFLQKIYLEARDADAKILLVLNPGAYTHTSIALMDALESVKDRVIAIEVHLSNIAAREDFRHQSFTARHCIAQISGLGAQCYTLAVDAFVKLGYQA